MTHVTVEKLRAFSLAADADTMAPLLERECQRVEINTLLRLSHFLGELHHESAGLTRFVENLNYSSERLMAVWPRRFPTEASTIGYAHNPAGLAEKVYGNRPELGNVHPGDGAKFIGRGLLQITGRANYVAASGWTGLDLVADPELAAQPANAARIAADFWRVKGLNALADKDDLEAVRRKVNGALVGLDECRKQVARARVILAS